MGDVCQGVIERCEAPRRLELSWEFAGEPKSRVVAEVRADVSGALLVLDHTRIDGRDAVQYGAGWQTYLERIDAILADEAPRDWGTRYEELTPDYRQAAAALGVPA